MRFPHAAALDYTQAKIDARVSVARKFEWRKGLADTYLIN